MFFKKSDDLVEWFEGEALTYYAISTAKDGICCRGNFDTVEAASEKLLSDISHIKDEFGTHYKVSVSDQPIKTTRQLKDCVTVTYMLSGTKEKTEGVSGTGGGSGWLYQELKEMRADLQETKQELLRLRIQEESEDDDIIEEQAQPNIINGILGNPQVQQMFPQILAGLIGKLFDNSGNPVALAGIPENNDLLISKAIERLKVFDDDLGNDLNKLADMAENDAGTFNFLIKTLRS